MLTVFRRVGARRRSQRACARADGGLAGGSAAGPAGARGAVRLGAVDRRVSACGLSIVIGGKMSLGRSFGLMPANRGVVSAASIESFGTRFIWATSSRTWRSSRRIRRCGTVACWPRPTSALLARAVCEEGTLARAIEYRGVSGARALDGSPGGLLGAQEARHGRMQEVELSLVAATRGPRIESAPQTLHALQSSA